MPTYTLHIPAGRLAAAQLDRMAAEITRVHSEVTGAAGFFAQVIVHEVAAGRYYAGGRPLAADQLFLHGQIRAGRSAQDRTRLLLALRDVVTTESGAEAAAVWVYLVDLPARDMVEYGHVLPEPGGEGAWMAALPEADRAWMQRAGRGALTDGAVAGAVDPGAGRAGAGDDTGVRGGARVAARGGLHADRRADAPAARRGCVGRRAADRGRDRGAAAGGDRGSGGRRSRSPGRSWASR